MRRAAKGLLGVIALASLTAGCRTQEAKSGEDAQSDLADGPPQGSNEGGNTRAVGVPTGPVVAIFPAFEVLPDGRTIVTVQVRGPVTVAEQRAEGRIIYSLTGVGVSDRVNRLPLVTQHFPTQVTSVQMEQTPGGANLIIDLREPSPSTFKVQQNEAGQLVTITLPRSERYSDRNPANDPNSFERPTDAKQTDFVEGASEENQRDRDRRRKKARRQPIPYVERPLTLPKFTLAPDIAIAAGGYGTRDQALYLTSGVRFGIIDQVEIEATPHAFRLYANPAYYFPSFGITAGYTGHKFEVAGRLRYFVGVDSDVGVTGGALLIGVPVAIHLGKWGRIDTGAFLTLDFENSMDTPLSYRGLVVAPSSGFRASLTNTGGSPFYLDNGIPFHFLFQPAKEFWFGIHNGINILDFNDVGETFALPLGAEIGLSGFTDFNPTADLGIRADLPLFIVPGRNDVIEENAYEIGVWFRWYHHM